MFGFKIVAWALRLSVLALIITTGLTCISEDDDDDDDDGDEEEGDGDEDVADTDADVDADEFDVDDDDEDGEEICDKGKSLLLEFSKPVSVSTALAELVDITVTLEVGWLINRPSFGTSIGTVWKGSLSPIIRWTNIINEQ